MNLTTLERRIRTLESTSLRHRLDKPNSCPSVQEVNDGRTSASWVGDLDELAVEARLITKWANSAGDLRTALVSIRVRCSITELAARLRGDLDERSETNILNITLDPETARRIAETYLARHKPLEGEEK
jgi:hypothetical protein